MKFNYLTLIAYIISIGTLLSHGVIAADTTSETTLSATQKKEVEKVIHDYLLTHPEILLEASQILQQKQQEAMQQQAQVAIKENASQLFNDNLTMVGNPKANVTLVEFFDYQCIHCKKMDPIIQDLLKKDKNLKIIFKEFPIFGKTSELAAQAALAAAMQGKYLTMHDALIKQSKALSEESILTTAKSLGLNMLKLKTDMDSGTVTAELNANRKLAEQLHLMGTPAFIIASTPGGNLQDNSKPIFIPGATSEQSLQDFIQKANNPQ